MSSHWERSFVLGVYYHYIALILGFLCILRQNQYENLDKITHSPPSINVTPISVNPL